MSGWRFSARTPHSLSKRSSGFTGFSGTLRCFSNARSHYCDSKKSFRGVLVSMKTWALWHTYIMMIPVYGHHPTLYLRLLCLKYQIGQRENSEAAKEEIMSVTYRCRSLCSEMSHRNLSDFARWVHQLSSHENVICPFPFRAIFSRIRYNLCLWFA